MKKIKVLYGGCGIKYTDDKGNARHALKTAENGPFECDDEQADRLVKLGVAAYVEEKAAQPVDPSEPSQTLRGHLDAADLEKWDYNDLKALAADMGVKPASQKKADIIAALVAVEVYVDPEDAVEDPDAEDPDELPDLSAADPE